MSILIKDMKMPESCADCIFSGFGGLRNERVVCMFTGANAYMNTVQHLDDCPLVPVPPHGDLIDRDALIKGEGRYIISFGKEGIDVAEINRAPTIIPAEEGE